MGTAAGLGDAGRPKRAELTAQSGVQQHHRDQHGERHERDHEEQNEVLPATGGLTGRAGLSGSSGRSAVGAARSSRVTAGRAAVQRWSNSSRLSQLRHLERLASGARVDGEAAAADPATQPPANGDARTASRNRNRAAKTMRPQPAAGERPASMLLPYIWILLFGFVGTTARLDIPQTLGSLLG
jgi:hypothetical protein